LPPRNVATLPQDPVLRIRAFDSGVNMLTCFPDHLAEVLQKLASIGR
jgi:hypothetical protein